MIPYLGAFCCTVSNAEPVLLFGGYDVPVIYSHSYWYNSTVILTKFVGVINPNTWTVNSALNIEHEYEKHKQL